MSKAEKFIQDYTMNCSNILRSRLHEKGLIEESYNPWLSPDQARRAVEIEKEEMTKRVCDAYCKVCGHYHHTTPNHICRQACDYYKDFIQAMKDD